MRRSGVQLPSAPPGHLDRLSAASETSKTRKSKTEDGRWGHMRPPPVIRTGYALPDAGWACMSKAAAKRHRRTHRDRSRRKNRKPPDVEGIYRRLTIGASQIAKSVAICDGAQAAGARLRASPVQKSR